MRCGLVGSAGETRGSLEPWLLACADESANMRAASCARRAASVGNRQPAQPRLLRAEKRNPASSAGLSGGCVGAGSVVGGTHGSLDTLVAGMVLRQQRHSAVKHRLRAPVRHPAVGFHPSRIKKAPRRELKEWITARCRVCPRRRSASTRRRRRAWAAWCAARMTAAVPRSREQASPSSQMR